MMEKIDEMAEAYADGIQDKKSVYTINDVRQEAFNAYKNGVQLVKIETNETSGHYYSLCMLIIVCTIILAVLIKMYGWHISENPSVVSYDKEIIYKTTHIDSLRIIELMEQVETLTAINAKVDSTLAYENYIKARQLEKLKYYITITVKTPSNLKFLKGWMERTLKETDDEN